MGRAMDQQRTSTLNAAPIGFAEFVCLVAALMSLTALGVDSMLPALPAIGASLHVANANERQFVITTFLIGFALGQLIYGPLADRFGRRPILSAAMAGTIVANIVVAVSGSFELLLGARFFAGIAVAAARVVTVALVRDCYQGRAMARVMSLTFIVFMAAPILAPNFGQIIIVFASWRWIFGGIAIATAAILVWFRLRMPETLPEHARQSLSPRRIAEDALIVVRDRWAAGYTVASALMSGSIFGFIGSIQQIMQDVFHRPHLLTLVFACVASMLAVGSFLNSRLVMRLGTRRISHLALVAVIAIAATHLLVIWLGLETLPVFILLQGLMMMGFSLSTSNFSAMAMENMGAIAGTASSLQGFVSMLTGALVGALIGQSFDGTTVPLYTGFLLMAVLSLGVVAITERGRLFRPAE